MLLALNSLNERIEPEPQIIGKCLYCNHKVFSKCGTIKTWHWAHEQNIDCVSKTKGSHWANTLKKCFNPSFIEKEYFDNDGNRQIGDIINSKHNIFELQFEKISFKTAIEIGKRSKDLIWIVFGYKYKFEVTDWNYRGWQPYTWQNPHKLWNYLYKNIVIDIKDYLVILNHSTNKGKCYILTKVEFLQIYNK
jgi:hypothetical protein